MLKFVPTPIGNLEDISIRALKALATAEIIFAEDTRVIKKLLNTKSPQIIEFVGFFYINISFWNKLTYGKKTRIIKEGSVVKKITH